MGNKYHYLVDGALVPYHKRFVKYADVNRKHHCKAVALTKVNKLQIVQRIFYLGISRSQI